MTTTSEELIQEFESEEKNTETAMVIAKSGLKIPISQRELQYIYDLIEKDTTYPEQICKDKELDEDEFIEIYQKWQDDIKMKIETIISETI